MVIPRCSAVSPPAPRHVPALRGSDGRLPLLHLLHRGRLHDHAQVQRGPHTEHGGSTHPRRGGEWVDLCKGGTFLAPTDMSQHWCVVDI